MNKQELKEKVLEIINNNYSEDYIMTDEGEIQKKYFDMDSCTEEIEALFKEVE
jgi:hypothetical protein